MVWCDSVDERCDASVTSRDGIEDRPSLYGKVLRDPMMHDCVRFAMASILDDADYLDEEVHDDHCTVRYDVNIAY